MNFTFWFIILVLVFLIWLLLRKAFKPIGTKIEKSYNKMKETLTEEESEE